ncbi:MAG: 50S ribosomal protein L11 methyltransferase [Ferruginibacter sp.]|nr:50S ribosomal protein L11 methyltransferase [Chitinophagaceae bacterium]
MNNFIQISFQSIPPEQQEILIAHLAEAGYEGFEESDTGLKAFVSEKNYDKELLCEITFKYQISFNEQVIPETNWNAVWESNFQPVIVDDFVAIRADFHEPITGVEREIIITPKMSFGTGHHATTFMMIREMREIDFTGKTVFDFGTGTGILAILAEKLGAEKILAADNDDWSIANATENAIKNNCSKIEVKKMITLLHNDKYDVVLANINKNVIVDNFSSLVKLLAPEGILLLSGLLEEDEPEMMEVAGKFPLLFREKTTRNNWMTLRFCIH